MENGGFQGLNEKGSYYKQSDYHYYANKRKGKGENTKNIKWINKRG